MSICMVPSTYIISEVTLPHCSLHLVVSTLRDGEGRLLLGRILLSLAAHVVVEVAARVLRQVHPLPERIIVGTPDQQEK